MHKRGFKVRNDLNYVSCTVFRSLCFLQKGCENSYLALFGEGTPNFMKSHLSLEVKKKKDLKKLHPVFHQHGDEQIMPF